MLLFFLQVCVYAGGGGDWWGECKDSLSLTEPAKKKGMQMLKVSLRRQKSVLKKLSCFTTKDKKDKFDPSNLKDE